MATHCSVPQHVAVIGAGIAGAALANRLALQGITVDVYEAEVQAAQLASGNLAGNCLPIIDTRPNNPYAQWHWHAWRATIHWWQQQPNREQFGRLTGAAKWSLDPQTSRKWQHWAMLQSNDIVQWHHRLPLPHQPAGLWFPQGGYLRPKQVVQHLLNQPNIRLHNNTPITRLINQHNQWQLISHKHNFNASVVVIATGAQTAQLLPEWHCHIQRNKGQVTHIATHHWRHSPNCALSYGGYATPAVDGIHCVGASFSGEAPLTLTQQEQQHNLALLAAHYPQALTRIPNTLTGHSAYRAHTFDRLPLVGPLVDVSTYQNAIQPYCHQPDKLHNLTATLLPNLWLTVGHGSHGLTSSFLAAELLSHAITQQPLTNLNQVESMTLLQATHPARSLFRHLCRQSSKS